MLIVFTFSPLRHDAIIEIGINELSVIVIVSGNVRFFFNMPDFQDKKKPAISKWQV